MEWISVNDRLPIEEGDLQSNWHSVDVIACKGHYVFCCTFQSGGTIEFWNKWDCEGSEFISHWMPLPQPPK